MNISRTIIIGALLSFGLATPVLAQAILKPRPLPNPEQVGSESDRRRSKEQVTISQDLIDLEAPQRSGGALNDGGRPRRSADREQFLQKPWEFAGNSAGYVAKTTTQIAPGRFFLLTIQCMPQFDGPQVVFSSSTNSLMQVMQGAAVYSIKDGAQTSGRYVYHQFNPIDIDTMNAWRQADTLYAITPNGSTFLISAQGSNQQIARLQSECGTARSQPSITSEKGWVFSAERSPHIWNQVRRQDGRKIRLIVSCSAQGFLAIFDHETPNTADQSGYSIMAEPNFDGGLEFISSNGNEWTSVGDQVLEGWRKASSMHIFAYGEDVYLPMNTFASALEELKSQCGNIQVASLPSDFPAEFATGALELRRSGGCSRTYRKGGYSDVANLAAAQDWLGASRRIIELGCNTNTFNLILGITAKNYGYRDAALIYFQRAIDITDKNNFGNIYEDCAIVSGVTNACMGVNPKTEAIKQKNLILNAM